MRPHNGDCFRPLDLLYSSPFFRTWLLEDHLVVTKFPEPEIYVLNPTAAALWIILLEGKKTVEELAFEVSAVFSDCSPNIHGELAACLKDWTAKQWIKIDHKGSYFICPGVVPRAPDAISVKLPIDSKVIIDKLYWINGHEFRFIIRTSEGHSAHHFLSRLSAITTGFSEAQSHPTSQLELVITSDGIYLNEDFQGFMRWEDETQALGRCLGYFLHVSAGKLRDFLTLHAAALGRENCVLLSGVSGAGKSTLCALLALQGWNYFGDDLVGLAVDANAEGRVVPLPSAISVKSDNWDLLSDHYRHLASLDIVRYGGKIARYLPLPSLDEAGDASKLIKGIIFPKYSPHSQTIYQPISVIDALIELVHAGVSLHRDMNQDEVEFFLNFLRRTPLYRLEYSDIHEVNTWLSTLVKS